MATIVFNAVGSALGGPIGGAVGALLGRQVDGALFGSGRREGARLKELTVTTSTYGQPIPRHFGKVRTAGSIIWGTDLAEHSETQGTGKSGPAVTIYSYTASFAVALASRPILGLGRIWADGKLLRGAAGDLKAGGTLRLYKGGGDEEADPLLLAAEGADRCPAYRGLAYAVFEDLDLSDFYNRIPALTFEVIADEEFGLDAVIGDAVPELDAAKPLPGVAGFTAEGSPAQTLEVLGQVFPLSVTTSNERLVVGDPGSGLPLPALGEPTLAAADDGNPDTTGYSRSRAAQSEAAPAALRYFDTERDYLPGIQYATGRMNGSAAVAIDLPASLNAGAARGLIETVAHRNDWSRERIAWRTAELDPAIIPGMTVTLPYIPGRWRLAAWEWQEAGIEISLERAVPPLDPGEAIGADPGRLTAPRDALASATKLVAYELPLGPDSSEPDRPLPFAAVSSGSADWAGAALYADTGDGDLHPLGPSGRRRSVIGTTVDALAPANPLVFDRTSRLTIALVDAGMHLASTDMSGLAAGANLALVGSEIIQFMTAIPLGGGLWRIEGLLRGRGGTETGCQSHEADEPFVLLDARPVALDATVLGTAAERHLAAIGRAEFEAVTAPVLLPGITLRPLSPVHPRRADLPGGGLRLSWTRRARGGWPWRSGMEVPLVEQEERYLVSLGTPGGPIASWSVTEPRLELTTTALDALPAASGMAFTVQQQGTHGLSLPLALHTIP